MGQRIENRGDRGFSLVETLAVVAILVILLSLSAVAAAYYRDYLKITELDNAAREIYMAAENRAVLLGSGDQMDKALAVGGAVPLAEGGDGSRPVCVTYQGPDGEALDGLLTSGAIDPALLDGQFHIVYDPASGGVTDVFYTEGPEAIQEVGYALTIAGNRDARMRETPMLGYYGGEQAAREDYTPLPAPEVMVVIHNEDLLTVDVTFSVPDIMYTATQTVDLIYGDLAPKPLDLSKASRTVSTSQITYTWVLDALDTPSASGRHFWQLFDSDREKAPACGGDFTVTAKMELSAPGRRPASASGSDTGNSLFAERSGGSAAQLENLRHLQNLDTEASNVGGKTSAVLLNDIDCCGKQSREPYGLYEFKPIVNNTLRSFDGGWTSENGENRRNEITGLHVTADSAGGKDGAEDSEDGADGKRGAGLFAKTGNGMRFTGVRLIDADISAGATPAAGVLVGAAGSGSTFQDIRVVNSKAVCPGGPAGGIAGMVASDSASKNYFLDCRVYWEPEEDQDNLRSLLGSDQRSNPYKYGEIVHGTSAGGLAGELSGASGATEIQRSLAATLADGAIAGGLIGNAQHAVTVDASYADCYIKGTKSAAGLIGRSGTVELKNVYTAGFIDCGGMETGSQAAGLVNTAGTVSGSYVYDAMSFLDQTSKVTVKRGVPDNSSGIDHWYYLDPTAPSLGTAPTENGPVSYDDMSTVGVFDTAMGGAFAFKTAPADTNPYNLQEKQTLNPPYSFPGLKGIPHYGDWRAYFKEPSLVYYEKDSSGTIGFSGGNARELIGQLEENITVETDGYAVARQRSDLAHKEGNKWVIDIESFQISYISVVSTVVPVKKEDGTTVQEVKEVFRYEQETPTTWQTKDLLEASWTRKEAGKDVPYDYYLIPLPDELVTGAQTSKDFYQYFRFEITEKDKDGTDVVISGEYFYNPHFAETVRPYVPEKEGKPFIYWGEDAWTGEGTPPYTSANAAEGIHQYITETLVPGNRRISVSVRTPRHLFHLSQYEDYYNNARLAFQQGLRLDGKQGVYRGYEDKNLLKHEEGDRKFQLQSPIGTQDKPFLGSYNGNCLPIRRVAFQIPMEEKNRVCAGLFGSSGGTLENIDYSLNPDPATADSQDLALTPRSIPFPSSEKNTYLGALVGLNTVNGKINNCAVDGVSLTSQVYSSRIYVGGLCGTNQGSIRNSAAECAYLHADASNYGYAYVGGLAGYNSGEIRTSYAVGRLAAEAAQENAHVYLGGFVSQNSGSISDSYCAMDLKVDGANARAYGFCASSSGGRPGETCRYLNDGNFTYRGQDFLAKYAEGEGSGAQPISYTDLTAENPPVAGMQSLHSTDPELVFPYPTGVEKMLDSKTGTLGPGHYGRWPKPLKLGNMGVYYWEELQIPGKAPSYHVSLLAVDPGENAASPKTITKISTLSTAHDQGGEVTRYGYGIFDKKMSDPKTLTTAELRDTPFPLLYEDGAGAKAFNQAEYQALEASKKNTPGSADKRVDEELEKLMSYDLGAGYQFHSFHTYGQNGGEDGLYPDSAPATPNGTLTLHQGGNQEVTVTFALNPLFADALAVEIPKEGKWSWSAEDVPTFSQENEQKDQTKWSGTPGGSETRPYGVRSIDQLQFIDWNSTNRDTDTRIIDTRTFNDKGEVISIDTEKAEYIGNFPYLSSSGTGGKYFWKQSYDLLGKANRQTVETGYTPIAEYYDRTGGNQGNLTGWFGGVYNGGSYKIENVNITGQQSSCAGLFGVVYDGSLENVVLYSSDGKGVITTKAGKKDSLTESRWFAMGGLAGVAGTSDRTKNAIKNCSIAGYTILAEVYTYTENAWGGNNIGGLVGSSHMNFSGCSAVVDIKVQNAVENDNMRVGGLAGICLGTLTNCYAGGSITLDSDTVKLKRDDRGIYVGGLVGGSYMKPLKINGSDTQTIGFITDKDGPTSNTLSNCYSYVRLPAYVADKHDTVKNEHFMIKGMFVVGGAGEIEPSGSGSQNHGTSTLENCYYLASESLSVTSAQTILGAKIKTDLGASQSVLQDGDLTPGKEFSTADKFWEIAEKNKIYNFRNIEEETTETIYNHLYYRENITPEKGVGLFRYTERNDDKGHWIYEFYGWLVDTSTSTWTYTTDPDYFTADAAVTNLTYEQLSGPSTEEDKTDPVYQIKNEKTIYDLLPSDFQRVTTEEDGVNVPGKYSYSTKIRPDLRDRNYPFPTVLTREGGKYHVHYGDWPLKGFRRQTLFDEKGGFELLGGSPIEIDLFVNGTAPHKEYLVLTDKIGTDGKWSFEWESQKKENEAAKEENRNPKILEAIAKEEISGLLSADEIQNEAEKGKPYYLFTLTPKKDGTDILYISYTVDGVSYTLPVTVHITSVAELRPNRLFMFPNDTVDISVQATDKAGVPLDGRVENGKLVLKGDPSCGSSGYLTAKTLRNEAVGEDRPAIQFTTAVPEGAPELERGLGANADFAYTVTTPDPADPANPDKATVQDYGGGTGGDILIEIIQPWKDQEPDFIQFQEVTQGDGTTQVTCVISFPDHYAVGKEGTLRFEKSGNPLVDAMTNRPGVEWIEQEGRIALKLTYSAGVKLAEGVPKTTVSIPLKLTSGEADGRLIEGEQLHTLVLTVEKPAETQADTHELQNIDALPPGEDGQDSSARRRRWKRKHQRRRLLERKP